jgi:hypothetical protein
MQCGREIIFWDMVTGRLWGRVCVPVCVRVNEAAEGGRACVTSPQSGAWLCESMAPRLCDYRDRAGAQSGDRFAVVGAGALAIKTYYCYYLCPVAVTCAFRV